MDRQQLLNGARATVVPPDGERLRQTDGWPAQNSMAVHQNIQHQSSTVVDHHRIPIRHSHDSTRPTCPFGHMSDGCPASERCVTTCEASATAAHDHASELRFRGDTRGSWASDVEAEQPTQRSYLRKRSSVPPYPAPIQHRPHGTASRAGGYRNPAGPQSDKRLEAPQISTSTEPPTARPAGLGRRTQLITGRQRRSVRGSGRGPVRPCPATTAAPAAHSHDSSANCRASVPSCAPGSAGLADLTIFAVSEFPGVSSMNRAT
jgi:hypothetical protein